jgi:pentatricopeptide repeat protein
LHYRRADAAYPGYWLVDEHIAELLGAAGRYDEALAMYQSIVSNGRRPELEQAIGELCDLAGQSGPAAYWKQRALTAYLQSAQRGEVHYYHHLVDYYTDVAECGAEAVKPKSGSWVIAYWGRIGGTVGDGHISSSAFGSPCG